MHLIFKNVEIQNFQSIGNAYIDIEKQGIILVKGENTYENNATSNGSGKSSIFESIMWVLYGKTSNGISDVTNRYSTGGCYVKLNLTVDNIPYTIIRSIKHKKYKTGVILYKNDEDISGRNKSDTDKIIRLEVLKLEPDIFLTVVFMSQGYNSRLSLLSPSARKERIEVLSDTSTIIDEFKNKVSAVKDDYSNKYTVTTNSISYKTGQIDTLSKQISELTLRIETSSSVSDDDINRRNELTKIISKLTELGNSIYERLNTAKNDLANKTQNLQQITLQLNSLQIESDKLNKLMSSISTHDAICPTCKQKISNTDAMVLIKQYKMQYDELLTSLRIKQQEQLNATSDTNTAQETYDILYKKYKDVQDKIVSNNKELVSIPMPSDVESDKEVLAQQIKTKNTLFDEVVNLKDLCIQYNTNLDVATSMLQMITKDFRTYLLNNIISFVNSRLQEYSSALFSNDTDVIRISADSSKLDIFIGDALYDSCSGGEKRKADIAISIALRDLSLSIANISCNLLVIDEIFDTLDTAAIETVMSIIVKASDYVDTIFIVSHKDIGLAYDSIITVVKNKNRISEVTFT